MKQREFPFFVFGFLTGLLCFFEGGCASPSIRAPKISEETGTYHEVRKGETLTHIAQSYDIDVQSLIQVNRLPNPSKLSVGQLLYIPGRVRTVPGNGPGDTRNQTSDLKGHRIR